MAISLINISLLFLIGLSLFVVGRGFKDYTIGILGGFFIFIQGLFILTNPVIELSAGLMNTTLGSILVGAGLYIWVVGSIEVAKNKGFVGVD